MGSPNITQPVSLITEVRERPKPMVLTAASAWSGTRVDFDILINRGSCHHPPV